MPIAIIDYDMANLRSVQKAFEHVGHAAEIITRPEQVDSAERVVDDTCDLVLHGALAP